MANHVTKAQREALYVAALQFTRLNEDGEIIDFRANAEALAAQEGASFERARGAIARNARRMRHPDHREPPLGRPAVLAGGQAVTVYLPNDLVAKASVIGAGNVSEGVRLALEAA